VKRNGQNSVATAPASVAQYIFPTTFAQQRLWFLEQLQPGGTSYLVPWSLRIEGALNVSALEKSLNEIIQRHEVLRTTFAWKDETPVQVVRPRTLTLPILNLSGLEYPEQQAEELARAEASMPLDLERGPLFRAQLLRLNPQLHVLLLTMHHIIFDGWSRRILIQELSALYEAFCAGRRSPLPPPNLQYADYAVWQRKHLQGATLEKQLSYWRNQLADVPASLDLPFDRPRPAVQTFNGAKLPVALSKDLTQKLVSYSREQGATLFMTLLAGFQVLLSRYGNQDDVCVGTPIANRNRAELEEMIGFFANTLVLRTKLPAEASFQDVLARVRETSLEAYAHQDVPFEKLVEEIRPDRDLSQNPIFQVLFSLQNAPRQAFELQGLTLRLMDLGQTTSKFDISAFLSETPDGIRGRFEFNTDLFDAETIQGMITHFAVLLESALENPEKNISQLALLTDVERHQLQIEWNETTQDFPRELCLHQLIERQAAQTPDAIACIQARGNQQSDLRLTYRDLNAKANQLAHALRRRGVGRGQRVGICVERSLEMMIGLLGIQKSGAAYVPLDPAYPPERIRLILEEGHPSVLIIQQSLAAMLPCSGLQVLLIDDDWPHIAEEGTVNPAPVQSPDDLAYVIFTSGSTGRPKGVQIRHRSVVNLLTFMAQELRLGSQDVFPALASFAFDMCIPELYLPLISGGCVLICPRNLASNGEELSALLRLSGATIVHATPTTWKLLVQAGFSGKGLKRVIGAEPVPVELCRRLLELDNSLYNFYGPTETTVWSAFHHFQSPDETVVVGRPLANTRIYILDKNLQPVPAGVLGEIHIGGEGVAAGYLNQPELTSEKFVSDPFSKEPGGTLYKTGDLGRFLRDGRIEFQGRTDHQVKIRGFRVELGEIEAALSKHPGLRECAVVSREDVPGDKRLVAYVVPAPGQNIDSGDVRTWLKERLPDYMVPSAVVELSSFPLTPNGKMDRKALPKPEYVRPELASQYQSPRTPIEETVCGVWADVLKLSQIGTHDNFFELGGHSLLATQVVVRLRDLFRVELPLRRLFESPTVAGLADEIERLQRSALGLQTAPIVQVPRNQPLPLSFAQQRMWFLDKLEPNNHLYNVPHVVRMMGALNPSALERAINQIVARHEALRTTFPTIDGKPVQRIAPALTVSMILTDLSTLPERVRDTEARRLALTETARPFNLESGPLIKVALLKLGSRDHVLVLNTHHIVSDRWSLNTLWKELVQFYESTIKGQSVDTAPLQIQYADFTVWQREYIAGDRLHQQLDYWKKKLEGAPSSLDLPTDRARPAQQSFRGAKQMLILPASLNEQLQALGRHEGATLFMTLLAAFNVLLARYSGQDDILVGSPIAGRTRPELEKLIGFFVNTLVFRTQIGQQATFRELLTQVRETAMQAYAHQDVPFEKLVEELKPDRDLSRNPLFQVMFILQNAPVTAERIAGIEVNPFLLPAESSKFDLTLIAAESKDGLRATIEYNTDLFDGARIERMLRHLQVLLEGAVASPDKPVLELPLLTSVERQQILVDWNQTATAYPPFCLHQLFEQQALRTPAAIAVIAGGERITYRALEGRANQLAHYLRKRGITTESLVGIYLERSINMVAALLAVLKTGAAYIPLDPAYPAERIGFILEDSGVALLLSETGLLNSLPPQYRKAGVAIDTIAAQIARADVSPVQSEVRPNNLAYVLYTSGSTGKPKGVEITHENLVNFLASMQRQPGITVDDVLLAVTTLSFDIAGLEIYLPLITGAQLVVASRNESLDGRLLLHLMRRHSATIMQATPVTWRMLIEAGWQGNDHLKILCGGEAMPADLAAQLLPRCAELWNMYGPTETTIWSSIYRVETAAATAPIGHPIANTGFYVLDGRLQPVPIGVAGELYIGGTGVARGYFRRPELTAERFVPDPFSPKPARLYRTGDIARYLPDGNVQYLGRTDFQVKIRGFRIELGEIETALAKHPAVLQAVVAAREDAPGDKRLVAYVVTQPGQHLSIPEARAYLKQSLPDYMVPSVVVELGTLPLTPNGKVDRKALPKPDLSAQSSCDRVPPRDDVEEGIAKIWREILGLQAVGVTENFFDLGGHSLMAVRLMNEISKLTGVNLPLTALFQGATVERLADLVRGTTTIPTAVVHQIQAGSDSPPFFAAVLAGVNSLGYVPLAKHLGPDQPFYTLQSPGPGPRLSGKPYTVHEYEAAAAEYVRAMQTIQPHGPYYIGGTCEGARIAFEMVRILESEGETVDLLAIIDTWVIENTQNRWLWKIYYYYDQLRRLSRQSWSSRLAVVRKAMRNRLQWWTRAKSAPRKSEWTRTYWPGEDFVPAQIHSRITVFKIPKQPFYYRPDPLLGWGSRTTSSVSTELVPHGRHLLLLREPYVRELAAALSKTLKRVMLDRPRRAGLADHQESADTAAVST